MATVTPGKIFTANEIVTPTNLNALGVPTVTIADSEVTTAKIADANVTTAKIADANVTTAKIADGAVTQSKLNASVTLVPTGAVMPFAMNSAPSGWLAADGTAVSRLTYSALFESIGTIYGAGNGSTTFNLPDLRGYFVRGVNTNSDGTASGAFGTKQADSYKSHNHGGITGTGTTGLESQGHTHSGTTGGESNDHAHYVSGTTGADYPDHTHSYLRSSFALRNATAGGNNNVGVSEYGTDSGGRSALHYHDFAAWTGGRNNVHTHNFTTGGVSANHTHNVPSLSISADGSTETRPKNIALLYCIKA
jgi:microcystin-dependent protein